MYENLTRADLRQRIGAALNEITVGTADSGSTTTLVDADLIDALESEESYVGAWAWMLDSVYPTAVFGERRVSAYSPATGTLTFSRAWAAPREAGMAYELHRLIRPSVLNDLIHRALTRLAYVQTVEIPVIVGQRQYELAALGVDVDGFPWLRDPAQVLEVSARRGETGAHSYRPLPWWDVQRIWDGANLEHVPTLLVQPHNLEVEDTLILQAWRTHRPYTDDGTAMELAVDWVESLCLVLVYEHLTRHAPAQDAERYLRAMEAALVEFHELSKLHTPRSRRRVLAPGSGRFLLPSDLISW